MLSPTISKARPAAGTAGIIRTGQLGKGRFSKAFSCRILNCSDPVPHGKASCGVFKGLSVSDCWNIIQGLKSCKLCLRHAITATCNQEKAVGGKKVCGVQGCKEAHHPLLHCDSALSMKLKVTSRFRFPKAVEAIPQVVQKSELVEDGSEGEDDDVVPEVFSPMKFHVEGKMVDLEVKVLPLSKVVPDGGMVKAKVVEALDGMAMVREAFMFLTTKGFLGSVPLC